MPEGREPVEVWERRPGASLQPVRRYRPREPERTLLHAVVRERLEPFLAAARDRSATGRGLPARRAALAAECARAQGRFWDYSRILFARQGEMGSDAFRAWAGELPGIGDARFDRCLVREEPLQRIVGDQALATELGANGTPTFFINGRKLAGAQPLEAFSALIEEELAKARASGIPAREFYQRTVEAADGR